MREKADAAAGQAKTEENPPAPPAGQVKKALRMGMIVSVSGVCGGIAAVLWNRRLLSKLHQAAQQTVPEISASWEDSEES